MISTVAKWAVAPGSNIQINSVAIDAHGQYSLFAGSGEFARGCFAVYCYYGAGAAMLATSGYLSA